jgi:2-polyprenyl-3-methyl-5-hydroxy-6-metoxy-1,4-benzoquinol methylase
MPDSGGGIMKAEAKESQNQIQFDNYSKSPEKLGPYTTHIWRHDPRHLGFLLARYKFCAKMLDGKHKVLDIGCGDGFGIPVILQTVSHVHGIDWEPLLMEDNQSRLGHLSCSFACLDITESIADDGYDGAYSLDVIEHIPANKEKKYFENIRDSLTKDGIFIVGTPNVTANEYASESSKKGHINLKSHSELSALLRQHFHNVLMFSMNDEVVHTGYGPMAHYLIGIGIGPRSGKGADSRAIKSKSP